MSEKSALLIIGNEILSGRTADKNANYIGLAMSKHGVPLAEVRVVPDIEAKIIEALDAMRAEYNYVFTTGGIGPTHDDITAVTVAKTFDLPFERHAEAYQALLDYYGAEALTEARATMADMPRGAVLIPNPVSGAPGFKVGNVYVMAGVPRIMQGMLGFVIEQIAPGAEILSHSIACDLKESVIAEGLGEIQARYGEDVDIGSYPNFKDGVLSVSVVVRGVEAVELARARDDVIALIADLGGVVKN